MDISKIVYGPKFEVSVPQGELSDEGQGEILALLENYIPHSANTIRADLPEDWVWDWKVAHGLYAGTLPKRLQSFIFKKYQMKLEDRVVTNIGNLANQHTLEGRDFVFDFDNTLDWHAGDYGDAGSCFWGGKNYILPTFRHFGGFAMRIYLKQERTGEYKGVGRALLYPYLKTGHGYQPKKWGEPDALLVFNGYGKEAANYGQSKSGQHYGQMQMLDYARLLAMFLGVSYQRARLAINDSTSDPLYVNNEGSVVVVGPVDEIKPWKATGAPGRKNYYVFAVKWPSDEMRRFMRPCCNCGRILSGDDPPTAGMLKLMVGPDAKEYCEECLNKVFVPCMGGCGARVSTKANRNLIHAEVLGAVPGITGGRGYIQLCNDCIPKQTFICAVCGDRHHVSDKRDYHIANGSGAPTRSYACVDCARNRLHLSNCPDCGRSYSIIALMRPIRAGGGLPARKNYGACPHCRGRAKRKAAGEKDEDTGVMYPIEEPTPQMGAVEIFRAVQKRVQADRIGQVVNEKKPIYPDVSDEILDELRKIASYVERHDWLPTKRSPYLRMVLPRGGWEINAACLIAPLQKHLDDVFPNNPNYVVESIKSDGFDNVMRAVNIYFRMDMPWNDVMNEAMQELCTSLRVMLFSLGTIDPEETPSLEFFSGYFQREDAMKDYVDALNAANQELKLGWPLAVRAALDYDVHTLTVYFN